MQSHTWTIPPTPVQQAHCRIASCAHPLIGQEITPEDGKELLESLEVTRQWILSRIRRTLPRDKP